MKRSMVLFQIVAIVVAVVLVFSSCDTDFAEEDTSVIQDNALVEGIFADQQSIADQAHEGKLVTYIPDLGESILSQCAIITLDLSTTPKMITVDFGTTNCLCADGRERRGKMFITFTGGYRDSGTVVTHSFDGYAVNDHVVKGIKTVTNSGRNTDGNISFSIEVDAVIMKPSQDSIIWKSSRTREWVAGEGTLDWKDDVYLITGTGSGVTAAGVSFIVEITKALRKEIDYKHFTEGTIEMTPSGKQTRILDYGDGTRDNKATLTIGKRTINLILA